MGIKVKHGGDIVPLARLALATGAAGLPRQPVPQMPRGGGGGRAPGGQSRVAGISAADLAVLEEDAAENAFEREMQGIQEEARIKAQQFKYEFTLKQRQELARLNDADQLVESDPKYADIRDQWRTLSIQKRAGITPRAMPRRPDEPTFEAGQAPGQPFTSELTKGAVLTTTIGSTGQPELKLILRPDQTMEYMREQAENEKEVEEIKRRNVIEAARQKAAIELSKIENIREGGLLYDKVELEQKLDDIFGKRPEQVIPEVEPPGQLMPEAELPSAEAPESEFLRRKAAGTLREDQGDWVQAAGEAGIEVTEADIALGPEVGQSQAFVRAVTNRYGKNGRISEAAINSMPPNILARFREAIAVLKRHYATVR